MKLFKVKSVLENESIATAVIGCGILKYSGFYLSFMWPFVKETTKYEPIYMKETTRKRYPLVILTVRFSFVAFKKHKIFSTDASLWPDNAQARISLPFPTKKNLHWFLVPSTYYPSVTFNIDL